MENHLIIGKIALRRRESESVCVCGLKGNIKTNLKEIRSAIGLASTVQVMCQGESAVMNSKGSVKCGEFFSIFQPVGRSTKSHATEWQSKRMLDRMVAPKSRDGCHKSLLSVAHFRADICTVAHFRAAFFSAADHSTAGCECQSCDVCGFGSCH